MKSAVLESLAAGKATLVEKPIAVDLKAADRMVAAAKKAGVPLMVAQVLPFHAEFQFVRMPGRPVNMAGCWRPTFDE